MKKIFLLCFVLAISLTVKANDISKSYYCEYKDQYIYKNVSCCTTRISKQTCEFLVEKYLSDDKISMVEKVTNGIVDGEWEWGNYPNCFWGALSYRSKELERGPRIIMDSEFMSYIYSDFKEIFDRQQVGDILVFTENYEFGEKDRYGKLVYEKNEEIVTHAAIYLENGFVFQKESQLNKVFSIDTVDYISNSILGWMKRKIRTKNHYVGLRTFRF